MLEELDPTRQVYVILRTQIHTHFVHTPKQLDMI